MTTPLDLWRQRVDAGSLNPDPDQERAAAALSALSGRLEGWKPGAKTLFGKTKPVPRGLYLWGGVGRGKSMLMDLFVESLDVPVRRVHFHAFMQEIQNGLHEARKSQVEDSLAPVVEKVAEGLRVLAFDEMQITDITDAMVVGRLFEMLFAAGVTVVTTSNRPPRDLYKDGLNRALFLPFIALIEARLEVIELRAATDYRQDRLTGRPVYFHPADGAARAAMDALWSHCALNRQELAG